MILDYTPEALADLDEIWDWNASKHGNRHANAYIDFLRNESDQLVTDYSRGSPVPNNPTLRYQIIRKRNKGHGHVVVYEVRSTAIVRILRYFHTAQDWHTRFQ